MKDQIGNKKDIVIVGFPKCGTTALTARLKMFEDFDLLRTPDGSVEYRWPLIKDHQRDPNPARVRVHKFTAYIYNPDALKFLIEDNPNALIVLCVRNPEKVLVSWHNMHRRIANGEGNKEHFAYINRDFYATCSLRDYYSTFAKRRLRYDRHFLTLSAIVPFQRIVVVAQERLARDLENVSEYLRDLARGDEPKEKAISGRETIHTGFADRSEKAVPPEIRGQLSDISERFRAAVDEMGVRHYL